LSRPQTDGGSGIWNWAATGALVLTGVVLVVVVATSTLGGESFSPGEDILDPAIEDVAASEESALYPPTDVVRFEVAPATVYVYLAVEELPQDNQLQARVEHSTRGSLLRRVFPGSGIEVVDEGEEQLSPDDEGASGVVKFAIQPSSGAAVPEGNYSVRVYRDGKEMARKRFVVGE
jgi:hypothetical protein